MPSEYGSLWKGAEEDESARTKKDADWAQRKAEQVPSTALDGCFL